MAITVNLYNHTAKLFANNQVDIANMKFMLLNSGGTFVATHVALADVAGVNTPPRANEVSGNGWTAGGIAVASAAVTVVTTNDAMLDAADISVTASGGDIGPALYGVLYDVTNDKVLAHVNFDGAKTAGNTTDFKVVWHANGIITWTY